MNTKIEKHKNPVKKFLREFGFKVIKLKYFILISGAMLLEIATLIVYLMKNESILKIDFFTMSILYGFTSAIIVVLAIGCIVLLKTDKSRDLKRIELFKNFKNNYENLRNKYAKDISRFTRAFDTENNSIDVKVNYAIVLSELYDKFLKDFLMLDSPDFVREASDYMSHHLLKEKAFYDKYAEFADTQELRKISIDSDMAHSNFLKEINNIERNLKLVI